MQPIQFRGRIRPVVEEVEPMGRGRAKAKQTKIAREIKYSTMPTDLERLAKELAGQPGPSSADGEEEFSDDEWDDSGDGDDEE